HPYLDMGGVVLMTDRGGYLCVPIRQLRAAALSVVSPAARREARAAAATVPPSAARGNASKEDRSHGFRPPADLVGTWTGHLRTWREDLPMDLTVDLDGDVHVDVDGQLTAFLDDADFVGGRLQGRYSGRIPTPDVMRHPLHSVFLNLRLEGDRLYGQASAQTEVDPTFYSLASFVDLARSR
ncbi:MAG: hypothetical protein R3304_12795, partial [Longimicrobiales bacterium]|nr:hypothetical protein [Longimicrobiales bacterium]